MGFFGDLKRATVAVAQAVGEGANALAEGAEALNRGLEHLNLELEFRRLQRHLENPAMRDDGETDSSIWAAMLQVLDDLIQRASHPEKSRWIAEKSKLRECFRREKVESLMADIKAARSRDHQAKYALAVDGVKAKQRIVKLLESLIALLKDEERPALEVRSQELLRALGSEIAGLETLRNQVDTAFYADGQKKSVIRRRDGQRHGESEYWHPGGTRKMSIHLCQGKINQGIQYLAQDSSVLVVMSMTRADGRAKSELYGEGGEKMMEISVDRSVPSPTGCADVWLWDRQFLGRAHITNGRPHRIRFLLGLLFRPLVLCAVCKAFSAHDRSPQAQAYLERFKYGDRAMAEIYHVIAGIVAEAAA